MGFFVNDGGRIRHSRSLKRRQQLPILPPHFRTKPPVLSDFAADPLVSHARGVARARNSHRLSITTSKRSVKFARYGRTLAPRFGAVDQPQTAKVLERLCSRLRHGGRMPLKRTRPLHPTLAIPALLPALERLALRLNTLVMSSVCWGLAQGTWSTGTDLARCFRMAKRLHPASFQANSKGFLLPV